MKYEDGWELEAFSVESPSKDQLPLSRKSVMIFLLVLLPQDHTPAEALKSNGSLR